MSSLRVTESRLSGVAVAPSSKSHVHRLLLLSLFSGDPITIYGDLNGDDICATLRFLEALGVKKKFIDGGVVLSPPTAYRNNITVDVGESGSTLRFAVSVSAALGVEAHFYGKNRLGERPLTGLKNCLGAVGVRLKDGGFPITVTGKIDSEDLTLDATESSQYVTGALYAVCLLGGGTLSVTGGGGSTGYVDMTVKTLTEYGFEISHSDGVYHVKSGDNGVRAFTAEGDWSGASFWISAGVAGGDIAVSGLEYPSLQPDFAIVEILRSAGGDITVSDGKVHAKSSRLHGIEFNADGCPDLVPAVAIALACAQGESVIRGISRLRLKESDRVKTISDMLLSFGADVAVSADELRIYGKGKLGGGVINSAGDHRITMSGAIGGAVADGITTVTEPDCVKKSYPDFWKDYISLGGRIDE